MAGALAQAGIFTTFMNDLSGGDANRYVFAISGCALIVTAIHAPEGLTGTGAPAGPTSRRRAVGAIGTHRRSPRLAAGSGAST